MAEIGLHAIIARVIAITVAVTITITATKCATVGVQLELLIIVTLTDVVDVNATAFKHGWLVYATTFTVAGIVDHSRLSQVP